jgi:pimeloyl-ACP methyl ester carboxylesterase
VLPGARDVDTPYGSIRVYEYGPEDGRKVLLVHGISTPAIALGSVANNLAEKGCRVMLFDLFGRGYSDNPSDVKHDIKLFTTQILLVLASSPLSWTGAGSGKFSMIGYSLGGGICTSFTSYFPDLVDSLILFAPAGLIRPHHISRTSRVLYSEGLFPESLLQRLIKSRLRTPLAAPPKESDKTKTVDATEAVQAEANVEYNSQAVLSKKYPHVTVASAVAHQVDHHPGFVAAFMSSIRYGPVREEHQRWRIVGERLGRLNQEQGINRKVLIVCGEHDPIIIKKELEEDATAALLGNVEFATFDAAHEIPVTKGDLVAQTILDFWERDV